MVFDAHGRMVNSNATPSSYVFRDGHYRPAPMPHFMEFSPAVGMHAGYLPGYPASHGCVRMPRDLAALFFERVPIDRYRPGCACRLPAAVQRADREKRFTL
jgi:hypothetical protein